MVGGIGSYSSYGAGSLYGSYGAYGSESTSGEDAVKGLGGRSSQEECETCKNRKYQDGSDENVSFKSASHIDPRAAASAVRAHEGEHVSNAYTKASQNDGKVLSAGVSIHTDVCPECGRVFVSGGETNTLIAYDKEQEKNPYAENKEEIAGILNTGASMDFAV